MIETKSQILNDSTVEFVVFLPFDEEYYSYSINNIQNQHLVSRDDLLNLIVVKNKLLLSKIQFLTRRFLSFIYVANPEEILELESSATEDEVLLSTIENLKIKYESKEEENLSMFDIIKNKFNSIFH